MKDITRWNKEYTNNKDLRDYLDYIKKFKVLSKEEQIALFNDYKKGNKKSFTKLINHNLRLPVSIAQKFIDNTNAVVNVFDLINEGNLALINATKRFDPSKDVKFSSFAAIMIKQSIIRFVFENEKTISIKYDTKLVINKIDNLIKDNPNIKNEELSKKLNIGVDTIKIFRFFLQDILSLNAEVKDTEESYLIDLIKYDDLSVSEQAIRNNEYKLLRRYVASLNEKTKNIIFLYYEKEYSLEEIGKLYNITREGVRQTLLKGYDDLRFLYKMDKLRFEIEKSKTR
mgnify:CR=1 FL=1